MSIRIVPLIMCGGAGTRLWPLSREGFPKQFIALFGERSTFQETLLRVADPRLFGRPIVITGAGYRATVLRQLAEIGVEADVLLESARRDSGPAIATGAVFAQRRDGSPVVLALAADHVVRDVNAFVAACEASLDVASQGHIVTFGIKPDRAATEYGYISPGTNIGGVIHAVREFVEKPDAATAARYVEAGYLWNSGNFMFRADTLLNEYRSVDAASVAAVTQAIDRSSNVEDCISLERAAFESAKPISIDYAVMERTKQAAVIPVSLGWSDVGSWRAVWELSDKDEHGNALSGPVAVDGSRNCYVATDKAVVGLEGVEDLVVVATADAVLVSRQADANGLKRLVARLKTVAPGVTSDHVLVSQPWGSHQSLDAGERYCVRRIVVNPGDVRPPDPLQRSGHWTVVRGTARVIVETMERLVREGESIHIPDGATCRLENAGDGPLELIEVQTGVTGKV